jgi:hypothetical protein
MNGQTLKKNQPTSTIKILMKYIIVPKQYPNKIPINSNSSLSVYCRVVYSYENGEKNSLDSQLCFSHLATVQPRFTKSVKPAWFFRFIVKLARLDFLVKTEASYGSKTVYRLFFVDLRNSLNSTTPLFTFDNRPTLIYKTGKNRLVFTVYHKIDPAQFLKPINCLIKTEAS